MTDAAGIPDDVARALSAFVRAEFLSPVASLRGLVDILVEDARAAGLDGYADDLERVRTAGLRLQDLVSSLLDGTNASASTAALRHDLRTPITAILGYGELIAEDARERGDMPLFEPLADVLDAAGRLLKELDKLVALMAGGPAHGGNEAISSVLQGAVQIAQGLARPGPSRARDVTGRILVVDDNESVRDLVSRRLTREGHDVTMCASGHAALRLVRRASFDLMLLDLMMPGLNGFEVLDRLRADPATSTIPVIVISALDEIETAVRCIEAGADDYLTKPLNETLLRARIGSSLERKFLRDREQDTLGQLRAEQARSEQLLRNVLPAAVVERLRAGETITADYFDNITVLFCDLVDFTTLAARLSPPAVIDLLNEVFSGFDRLAEENGLEKIKTIGDAYLVVGGMFDREPDHVQRTVRMACDMPAVAAAAAPEHGLSLRVGIHVGPVVAGIIGRGKFFYDVWGDTVNIASRLEATAQIGSIHVSEKVKQALDDTVRFEHRDPIEIKGKGLMRTFQVIRSAST